MWRYVRLSYKTANIHSTVTLIRNREYSSTFVTRIDDISKQRRLKSELFIVCQVFIVDPLCVSEIDKIRTHLVGNILTLTISRRQFIFVFVAKNTSIAMLQLNIIYIVE